MGRWYHHMGWLRVTALLFDITGSLILVMAVLTFKKTLSDEREIDDRVVAEIEYDRLYVIIAAVFLSVAFILLIVDEYIYITNRKKMIRDDVRFQAREWLEQLDKVPVTHNNEVVLNDLKQIFSVISKKQR